MTIVDATIPNAMTPDATKTDAMTPDAAAPAAPPLAASPSVTAAAAAPPSPASSPSAASVLASAASGAAAPAPAAGATTPAASPAASPAPAAGWVRVCRVDDLLVERGAAALIGDRQIALFRTFDGRLYATDQIDPFSGAAIMSRGIVGDRAGVPTVASPMYKQVFDLRTGGCLDTQGKEPQSLAVHPVAVADGDVLVKIPGDPR
ncbi:nitrite reductase small subunit NirD [Microbacterium proteolyticum]|uniref:nitrite reductase small subunit NirD n=1 Tax=Microbacterium proteolyticum TaxID=1572644 RepID=UPI0027E2A7B0|nr:nitrite reductase small subunit NirD [Microbacterium proteolyticum]